MRLVCRRGLVTIAFIVCSQHAASAEYPKADPLGVSFSAPQPLQSASWFDPNNDFPRDAFANGDQGAVGFMASVGIDGKAYRCDVYASSGSPSLDEATCASLLKRGRFKPARDESGNPIPGGYAQALLWMNPNTWAKPPGNRITANSVFGVDPSILPAGTIGAGGSKQRPPFSGPEGPAGVVNLQLVVEPDGHISGCKPAEPVNHPSLTGLACDRLRVTGVPPLMDEAGKPVRAVKGWKVEFSVEKEPALPQPGRSYSARAP